MTECSSWKRVAGRTGWIALTVALLWTAVSLPDPTPSLVANDADSSRQRYRRKAMYWYGNSLRPDRAKLLYPYLYDPEERLRGRAAIMIVESDAPGTLDTVEQAWARGAIKLGDMLGALNRIAGVHHLDWIQDASERSSMYRYRLYDTESDLTQLHQRWMVGGKISALNEAHGACLQKVSQ